MYRGIGAHFSKLRTAVYSLITEALNNVSRHARATRVWVHFTRSPRAVRVTIRDDGGGFDPRQVPGGRLGLQSMRERAAVLGGELAVCSEPGAGTRIEVTLPPPPEGDRI